ncbi:MAG: acetylxylan esterase [Clostridia bacterium]|nr:acetylxylan esterase [Clostridia bacterium]
MIDYSVIPHPPLDARFAADRHTDTVFPIRHFSSREEVDAQREELRFNLRMAAGLVPWPEKTPLNVRREPAGSFEGFTVEKIMFETRPGFWSTGNLFLPDPLPEKAPAILNVIGHWEPQRLTRNETADYPQQIANFTRMGFICLVTDMIGMVDSRQISHRYGGFSGDPAKDLWLSNGLGVQLWNNIRALDLLCSMPEVDPENIGMTGASGGGSQTLFLALLDERVKAAAPINMISLLMQGGCDCENAPGLRRRTENAEMCAMIAPRPLFLAGSTGDWTREQETREVPAVLEAYRQYGAEDMVEHYYQIAAHQYNGKTRARVYSFFARHLMGKDPGWTEQPVDFGDLDGLTWFRGEAGKHAPGIEGDAAFFESDCRDRINRAAGLGDGERKRMLAWITGIEGRNAVTSADGDFFREEGFTLEKNAALSERGAQIPFVRLVPDDWDGKRAVLCLSGRGKDCVSDPRVKKFLEDGIAVVSGDLFGTGETAGREVNILGGDQARKYYTCFHDTPEACRVQDVRLLWKTAVLGLFGGKKDGQPGEIPTLTLWAEGSAAISAALALPFLDGLSEAALEAEALDLKTDADYLEKCFLPGIRAVGGIEGALGIAAGRVVRF